MSKNIELLVADTILERPRKVTVGDITYEIAPPSIATLVLVSEAIGQLPGVTMSKDRMVTDSLFYAKECGSIGQIAAIIILGAKNVTETRQVKRRLPGFWGWLRRKQVVTEKIDRVKPLADILMENLTPHQLNDLTASLLGGMQLGDFFGLTTFLTEINLTKRTKVEKPTASGQQ